jgi:hypothetical protein
MNVTLYTPHKNQEIIHKAINEGSAKYYPLCFGRQWGKSMLAENQTYYWLFNDSGCKVAWVAPIYKQSKKVFDEMVEAFAGTGLIKSNASELTITVGKSVLQFFSAERYDNIRGFTFDYLICDEFAFMDSEAWTEVLRATVLVKGKKVLLISTPKGKNHFYRIFQLAQDNPQYQSFSMSSYDNPLIDPKEIDDARLTLPEHIFRQEYLAEFIDDAGAVFRNIKDSIRVADKTPKLFFAIDLGRADDYTVLTIINERNEEVFCQRWRHTEWSIIVNECVNVLNVYKPKGYVESNGAQDAIYEMIRNKVTYGKSNIEPFVTTSKNKQTIIEDLIVAFEEKSIGILGHDFQMHELEVFTYEYNLKTRNIRYSAPVGLHDDYVMSRAMAHHALKEMRARGNFSFKQL